VEVGERWGLGAEQCDAVEVLISKQIVGCYWGYQIIFFIFIFLKIPIFGLITVSFNNKIKLTAMWAFLMPLGFVRW